MTTTLNASTAGAGGFIATSDNSGILALQTAGTTAITVDASQIVSYTNNLGTVAGYPAYQCRAWVNFNGTGTVAIRASGNVSSITDNGTGDYTVNFTNALTDANYCVTTTTTGYAPGNPTRIVGIKGNEATGATTKTTSAVAIQSGQTGGANLYDMAELNVAIFR